MSEKFTGPTGASCALLRIVLGVGFRDIHAFNLVMLDKQVWRLIHGTHSLFY